MNVFEITIQRKAYGHWPVVVEQSQAGTFLPIRNEGRLTLDESELLSQPTPRDYGTELGKALFHDEVRDAFARARAESQDDLHLLLFVEDEELKVLHWERLCAPLDGGWKFLALDQRVLFALYLPAVTDRRFPPFGRRDLRALILVANPQGLEDYGLAPFDDAATVAGLQAAFGEEIPCDVLADVPEAVGPPTLDALAEQLTAERYTLLHVVAHGSYAKGSGDTVLYLAKAHPTELGKEVDPVPSERLIERLGNLRGARGLPHFAFLSVCESAKPEAERGLRGLGQRLVRDLGMPAVLAMTEPVTISTAGALAETFYKHLRDHGEPDRALVEAAAGLAERGDIIVPALYSRLGGRPLFSAALDRALTDAEIEFGLAELERLLPERAPVLKEIFAKEAEKLRGKLGADRTALSEAARQEWQGALNEVSTLCEEVLDLSFHALAALDQKPPDFDNRCPFPGLLAFGVRFLASGTQEQDDREFFFGREELIAQLERKLADHNFLPLLGPSGSGKSSLVLGGLIPALQKSKPDLHMAYMTPGFDPPAQLEKNLSSPTHEAIILVVDQFEELFTLCTDEAVRRRFLDRLLSLSEKLRVVITMRADFWGDCAPYRDLAEEMQAHQVLVPPMDHTELRSAVEHQANAVGLRFEADLVNTMLDTVRDEPGAMPLLQHLLRQLWERRHGRWLRASEYRTIGGVCKAIAYTAEEVYAHSLPGEKARLQDIFVRLTRLGEREALGEDWRATRRRVGMEELVPVGADPAATKALVTQLANVRLVVTSVNEVTGREEVEVAHEALIGYWQRLCDWLDEDRDVLRLREGIRRAALEWQEHEEHESYLVHREGRLRRTTKDLTKHPRLALNQLEQDYLDACWTLQTTLRLEAVLLKVHSALARYEPIRPSWLTWLRSDRPCALIRQLEAPDAAGLSRRSSRLASDKLVSLLGVGDVQLPDRSGAGQEHFGPVAWSAASHPQPATRQTAALALTALKPYPQAALQRLQSALAASAKGRRHRLRKAELRGALVDEDPDNGPLRSELSLMDRIRVWRWRAWRRVIRGRIAGLTMGGALGAGLAVGLLRGVLAPLAGESVVAAFFVYFLGAWILGAAQSFGILLSEPLLLGQSGKGGATPPLWRAPLHVDRRRAVLAICLGTICFGLAHLVMARLISLGKPVAPPVLRLGFVAGLGLSLALYNQPHAGWHMGILRWLLRLGVAALAFALTQAILIHNGGEYALAIVRFSSALEHDTASKLALMDAALVAMVLTIGITAGLRLAKNRLKQRRDMANQSDS
jgi:hypothetical protein